MENKKCYINDTLSYKNEKNAFKPKKTLYIHIEV